jgi:hypothetical protein
MLPIRKDDPPIYREMAREFNRRQMRRIVAALSETVLNYMNKRRQSDHTLAN